MFLTLITREIPNFCGEKFCDLAPYVSRRYGAINEMYKGEVVQISGGLDNGGAEMDDALCAIPHRPHRQLA